MNLDDVLNIVLIAGACTLSGYNMRWAAEKVRRRKREEESIDALVLLVHAMKTDGIFDMPAKEIPHTAHALQFIPDYLKRALGEG